MPGTNLGLKYTFLSKIKQDPSFHEAYRPKGKKIQLNGHINK